MLDQITPVILTFNEEDNIERTIDRLGWAQDVVVVDSYSTDRTIALVSQMPNVRLFQREFDTHSEQWNFAVARTDIKTSWILALDADYGVTPDVTKELASLAPRSDVDGYAARFLYCIWGVPIRSGMYPPVTILFRSGHGRYEQDGHTQRVRVPGHVTMLRSRMLHDDRKPLSRWLAEQDRYMKIEAEHLLQKPKRELHWRDRVRRNSAWAPVLAFAYSYLWKGGWRDGRYGLYYATQRMLAEALLLLRLIEKREL